MKSVFISYVNENKELVDELRKVLEVNGIIVWVDRYEIGAGKPWKIAIKHAIRKGSFFIACFSKNYYKKKKSFMNEELMIAVEELRKMSPSSSWFIPVCLDDCSYPDIEIGAGRNLNDYEVVKLSDNWEEGTHKIVKAIKPRSRKYFIPRYTVGRIPTNVYMDLLGGGDDTYDKNTLSFDYTHEWTPLPDAVENEREAVLDKLKKNASDKGVVFFNGPAVRLHSLDLNIYQSNDGEERKNPKLHLRPTCWYDFAISNNRLDDKIYIPNKGYTTIRKEFADEEKISTTRSLDWIRLTNILCITLILETRDEWTLIGRRTRLVDNSSGELATSAAENIHRWKDEPSNPHDLWSPPKSETEVGTNVSWDYCPLCSPNPFYTVIRGVKEEIAKEVAKSITPDNITFLRLAWNTEKFQPHLIAKVSVSLRIKEIEHILSASRGSDTWETSLTPVRYEPRGELREMLFKEKWAEISKAAILCGLVQKYGYEEVDKALA